MDKRLEAPKELRDITFDKLRLTKLLKNAKLKYKATCNILLTPSNLLKP